MTLSVHNICKYLIDNDLIPLKSIVEGDLMVRDASSRNTNFLINQFEKGGKRLLVKQPDIDDEKYVLSMKIEAEVYEFIHKNSLCTKLRKYVPKLHHYDHQNYILVMEQLKGVCRVFDYLYHGLNYADKGIIKELATILVAFHKIPIEKKHNLQATFPWFLEVAEKDYQKKIKREDKKAYKILQPIFDDPQAMQFVRDSKAMWQSTSFIHLDPRLTNLMMPYAHQAGQKLPIWLIDFEMAGVGDAAWDIGFLFGDLISFETYLKVKTPKINANKHYLTVADSIRYFWQIYSKSMQIDENFEERVVRYTAIKIFMLVYEDIVDEDDVSMSPQLKILIELFLDMVKNTENYYKILLGK